MLTPTLFTSLKPYFSLVTTFSKQYSSLSNEFNNVVKSIFEVSSSSITFKINESNFPLFAVAVTVTLPAATAVKVEPLIVATF